MNVLDRFFHRHTFDPKTWKEVGAVDVYEDDDDLTTWLYTVGQKPKERKVIETRKTYTNTCTGCGTLVSKTICL